MNFEVTRKISFDVDDIAGALINTYFEWALDRRDERLYNYNHLTEEEKNQLKIMVFEQATKKVKEEAE